MVKLTDIKKQEKTPIQKVEENDNESFSSSSLSSEDEIIEGLSDLDGEGDAQQHTIKKLDPSKKKKKK